MGTINLRLIGILYNDLEIDTSVLEEIKKHSKTIGEFLGKIRDIIAERKPI